MNDSTYIVDWNPSHAKLIQGTLSTCGVALKHYEHRIHTQNHVSWNTTKGVKDSKRTFCTALLLKQSVLTTQVKC